MHYDDHWHGSEDYPGPAHIAHDDFQDWADEMGWGGQQWNGWDTFLRRMLMIGGVVFVWMAVAFIIVVMVKG